MTISAAVRDRRRGVVALARDRVMPCGVIEDKAGRELVRPRGFGARRGSHRRVRRPVRLTGRGRRMLLVGLLVVCAGVAALAAAPGRAADPPSAPRVAVVQPGDTLWSFTARNTHDADMYAAVKEVRRLNGMSDHVVHPGQRLVLPSR